MPDTGTAYNWRLPVGGDILKIGVAAIRNLAADIATTIAGLRGGDARYTVATNAVITATATGTGVRVPFPTAEYSHADVTPYATDSSYFTLNKAGLWTIDVSVRCGSIPAGTRVQVAIADDAGVVFRANGQFTGAGATTLDIAVMLNKRFAAGQKIAVFLYTTAGTQPTVDTTAAAIARTSISLTHGRP